MNDEDVPERGILQSKAGKMPQAILLPVPGKPRPRRAKITVVEQVVYTSLGSPTAPVSAAYSREVESEEEVWKRRMTVGTEWVRLETGWLEEGCSLLVLSNSGEHPVEVATTLPPEPQWLLEPGHDMRGWPVRVNDFSLRCPGGSSKVVVTLFPR